MNVPLFNTTVTGFLQGPASSFGRHLLSYSMGAVTAAVGFGLINQTDATSITTDLTTLGHATQAIVAGVGSFMGAATSLVMTLTGIYAAWKSLPKQQAQAITTAVPGTVVATDPAIANALPNNAAVVNKDLVKIVEKGAQE